MIDIVELSAQWMKLGADMERARMTEPHITRHWIGDEIVSEAEFYQHMLELTIKKLDLVELRLRVVEEELKKKS